MSLFPPYVWPKSVSPALQCHALEANWWREHYLFLFCWYWEDDSILQSEMWVYSLAHAPFGKANSKCKIDRPKRLACENALDLMGPCGPKTMCMNLRCKRGNFTMLIRFRSLGSSGVTQPCSIGRRCDIMDSCMLRAQLGAQASIEERLLFWCVADFCRKVRSPFVFVF